MIHIHCKLRFFINFSNGKKKTKNHAYDTNVSPSDLKESLMSLYGTGCKKTEYPIFWM